MASFVAISNDEPRICVRVHGSSLRLLIQFLLSIKQSSPLLASDESFDIQDEVESSKALKFVDLSDCNCTSLAEIARLLFEALDPNHSFWPSEQELMQSEGAKFLQANGEDAEARVKVWRMNYLLDFRLVAEAIYKRLGQDADVGVS